MAHRQARRAALVALAISALLLSGCSWDSSDDYRLVIMEDQEPPPEPVDEVPDPALVRQVQQHLDVLGHRPGPHDGVLGPQTTAAIKAYQAAKGLQVDGRPSPALLAALAADHAALEAEAAAPAEEAVSEDGQAPTQTAAGVPPEPRYLPGSRYLYSNGEVQEVLATDGAKVRWQSNRSGSFVNHRNFIVPPLAWSADGLAGHRVLDVAPDGLWRQASLSDAVFVATTTTRYGGRPESLKEQTERWRCRPDGEETVTVVAGTFVTSKLVCQRVAADGAPELVRTWFYAASLRHYVLRREVTGDGSEAEPVELVAIQPADHDWPPAARGGLARAVQHVLDELPAGEKLAWSSSAVDTEITITAGDSVEWAGRAPCRRLQQTWTIDGDIWRFPRLACRDQDGKWRFPEAEAQQRLQIGLPS